MQFNPYELRGASSDKRDVHQSIEHLDKGLHPRAFCKILPDLLGGDEDFVNVLHADGAGTKSALAYLYWKETGDLSVWHGIAQDAIVMNTDDMMCVGITDNFLLSSTVGRNKNRIPSEVLKSLIDGTQAFIELMAKYGIRIYSAGGETADLGDLIRTIVVDATACARIHKNKLITNEKIGAGQVIVGLASDGQASYETAYNSGIGSNGLTSARHDFLHHEYATKYPESYDELTPLQLIYQGYFKLTDWLEPFQMTAGKFLLSPTRTYLPVVSAILQTCPDKIYGIVHCTGGGQTKALHFIQNLHIIKNQLFTPPFLFQQLQKTLNTSWDTLYKTFNMGHRLEIFTDPNTAEQIISIANQFNIKAQIIGHTLPFEGKKISIINPDLDLHMEITS